MNRDRRDWDDAEIQTLRKLWDEGLTTSAIGLRMNRTKSMICGKAHRLKLPSRSSPIIKGQPILKRKRQKLVRAPAVTLPPLLASVTAPISSPLPTPAHRVSHRQCCWPIGEPRTKAFRSCEDRAVQAKPYCASHCAIAYVKIPIE